MCDNILFINDLRAQADWAARLPASAQSASIGVIVYASTWNDGCTLAPCLGWRSERRQWMGWMIERFLAVLTTAGVALAISACAGLGTTGERGAASVSYRDRTGNVTEADLFNRLPRALARHGYLIVDGRDYHRRYHFTTQWKDRRPFEDEQARGVTEASTRIVMRAQKREELTYAMYVLHLEVQNRVRTAGTAWHEAPMTDAFEEYADGIARDLRVSIASGMRRF